MANQNEQITIQYMVGEKKLKSIKYDLIVKQERYLLLFKRKVYYVESEFVSIGPFYDYEEALKYYMGIKKFNG
jgi:hypothetical protein